LQAVVVDQDCFSVFAARRDPTSVRPQLRESGHLRLHVRKVPHQSSERLPRLLLLLTLILLIGISRHYASMFSQH